MSKKAKVDFNIVVLETAFKNGLLTLAVKNNLEIVDSKVFLEKIGEIFPDIIRKISAFSCSVGTFIIPKVEDQAGEIKYINTKNGIFFETSNPADWYNENIYEKMLRNISVEHEREWALKEIL